jgi:chloramphenicol 3-O phosphotransferase
MKPMPMKNNVQLIVLNGASSSGKTSLCKKLQEVLDEPYIHLEEDRFVFNTYHDRFLDGETGPLIFKKTMLGYYRSLKAFLSAGHNVLADTGFYTPELLHELVRELSTERVWLVGVKCDLSELENRERIRGDRQIGLAKEQHATIHAGVLYDTEVDTSKMSLAECALAIRDKVNGTTSPQAMARLKNEINSYT